MNLLYFITSILKIRGFVNTAISPKSKTFFVNVLAPPLYVKMYEQTHASLGTDLMAIASALASTFNNTTLAKSNGYEVAFELIMPVDNPIILKMTPTLCEGSIDQITDLLNEVNNFDNTQHYTLLIPCSALPFAEIFNSVGVEVPIIDSQINVQCSKRVAIFYEFTYQQLFSSFSNALLKILNAPIEDYNTIEQTPDGDDGLKTTLTIKEDTVYRILNSKCNFKLR